MKAAVGDWLVVKSSRDSVHERHAEIVGAAADGGPPYQVHWVDTGRETLIFPGPDAQVVSAAQHRASVGHVS